MKKGMLIFKLKKAGFESVEDVPRTAVVDFQKHIRICHHSSGGMQRRMVSKESECLCTMSKGSTASPNFLCSRTQI